jgi:uncharacterized protein (TIGR02996 family)
MLTIEQMLLDSLANDPGDDAAWMALADHLEEKGDERGEATRLSLWLRRRLDDPRRDDWEQRLLELLNRSVRVCLPQRVFFLPGDIALALVLVPPGSFLMGMEDGDADETPSHRVTLTRGFWLGVHPVTQAQWCSLLPALDFGFRGADLPAEEVNWFEAQEFCRRLSEATGQPFRLPSEAEWEYACRAGTATAFSFGPGLSSEQANFDANYVYGAGVQGVYRGKTTPSGTFPANAWGLYDLHGNVLEWCQDWYHGDYYRQSPEHDPPGPSEGHTRVVRGGSWYFAAPPARSAYRFYQDPEQRDDDLGFRVAASIPAGSSGR